ncbi:MAG: DUF4115 domain-containing protein [Candidatus Accumulibacter sp.]|nr:DUF4115 domain-containing protein [Accumulibacter sp.]
MSEKSVFSNPAEPSLSGGGSSREPLREAASVGQQLRAAREARNLSLADAAQSLKLGPKQVAALESEDWAALPGNTMIRGFVRNYARVLNLDADALMRGLDAAQLQRKLQLDSSAGTSASLPQGGSQAEQRDYLAVIGGLVLLVLALLAYFYVPQDFWEEQLAALTGSEKPSAPVESPAVVVPPPSLVVDAAKAITGTGGPTEAAAANATAPTAAGATLPAEAPAAVAGPSAAADKPAPIPEAGAEAQQAAKAQAASDAKPGDGLKLVFAQAAWVDVRDGGGEVVAFGLKPAGSQQDLKGQPPFSLVIGNAKYVTVEYKGEAVDLGPHINKGVARLTVK